MKIILSRKGFDSANGGCASPILPDETMLSMPIPTNDKLTYSDISYQQKSYAQYWQELCPRNKECSLIPEKHCHLDPDIRRGIMKNDNTYPGIFGQVGAAQTHLENQGVAVGDIFLFFGWFRKTGQRRNGTLKFTGPDMHVIYGYLQVGEIVSGKQVCAYAWHPHAHYSEDTNNTMYIASEKLTVNGKKTELPGYGVLRFDKKLVLTKEGYSRSKWQLPECLLNADISYHGKENRIRNETDGKIDYFQSAAIGQEFVIMDNDAVTQWALELIQCDSSEN